MKKEKGYIKFLKSCSLRGRTFKEGEIISADGITLSKEEFKMLVEKRAIVACEHRNGSSIGPTSIR